MSSGMDNEITSFQRPTISIICSNDGTEWNDYLTKCINNQVAYNDSQDDDQLPSRSTCNEQLITIEHVAINETDISLSSVQSIQALSRSKVILIVITPGLLDCLDSQAALYQLFTAIQADRTVAVLCGVKLSDVTPAHKTALVSFEQWPHFLSVTELADQLIGQVIDIVNGVLVRVRKEETLCMKLKALQSSNSPTKNVIGLKLIQRKVKEVRKLYLVALNCFEYV